MLERVSALAGVPPFYGDGAQIVDVPNLSLTQVAGDVQALKTAFPKLPEAVGVTVQYAGKTLLRIAPHQIWVIGTTPDQHQGLCLTPLSSSRSCISIDGPHARDALAKCAAVDFHPQVFKPEHFVMTGVHHMPVLIHCAGVEQFHVYVMRTFALSLWEVLVDAAAGAKAWSSH
jgi:heterotetrameric sarcosine oxidase gamma subunit